MVVGHESITLIENCDHVVSYKLNSGGAHTHHVLNLSHLDHCDEWTRTHFNQRIELSQIKRYGEAIECANETE